MLANAAAIIMPPTHGLTLLEHTAPYQLVLDFSSTTSLYAAVNAGPFLLRLTAIVMLSSASQLAIRDAPFLLGGVAMMLTFSRAGS